MKRRDFIKKNLAAGAVNHTDYPQEAYELGNH